MGGRRGGEAREAWGSYDPLGPIVVPKNTPLRYEPTGEITPYDPTADYIADGEWYAAHSVKSARQIQKAFEQQEVGCCLYERTGSIVQLGRVPRSLMPEPEEGEKRDGFLIAIQLRRYGKGLDWDLDLCLSELGVYVQELYRGPFT